MQMNTQTNWKLAAAVFLPGRRAAFPAKLKRLPLLAMAALVLVLLWTAFSAGMAMAQSSVMSVTGQAFWRRSPSASWQALRPGKLPAGAQVKTGRNATIRLIRPNGAIAVVPSLT